MREGAFHLFDERVEDERDLGDAWWELSDEAVDAVREGNERRFGAQIELYARAIGAGDAALDLPCRQGGESLARFAEAPRAAHGRRGRARQSPSGFGLTEEESSEDDPSFTWGDEALRFWESYYLDLEESVSST